MLTESECLLRAFIDVCFLEAVTMAHWQAYLLGKNFNLDSLLCALIVHWAAPRHVIPKSLRVQNRQCTMWLCAVCNVVHCIEPIGRSRSRHMNKQRLQRLVWKSQGPVPMLIIDAAGLRRNGCESYMAMPFDSSLLVLVLIILTVDKKLRTSIVIWIENGVLYLQLYEFCRFGDCFATKSSYIGRGGSSTGTANWERRWILY